MSHLPVISSIVSPQALAQWVGHTYGMNAIGNAVLLKAGINHTYRLECANGIFIFRLYSFNWRTKEEIEEELNLLLLLKENGLSVSYPLEDPSGQYIQTIETPEGERMGVLFSFAKGKKVQNYTIEAHENVGKLMAAMHRLTEGLVLKRLTYTKENLLDQSMESIRKFLPEDTKAMQFLRETKPVLEKYILCANEKVLRHGVVHLDFWFDNFVISEDQSITVFDFDFSGNGWLCLDLAYYVMQLWNIEKDPSIRKEKLDAFYRGYESVTLISAEEKRLIPYLGVCLYYFYLGVQCDRFENWSNTFINEVYLQRYVEVFIKGYYQSIEG